MARIKRDCCSVFIICFFIFCCHLEQIRAWRPCPELSSSLRVPCRCNVVPFGPGGPFGAVAMDCDRVVFHEGNPSLPYGAPIVSYTQRHSGQHIIPAKTLGTLKLPVQSLDFSNNGVRRLSEKVFDGIKETLVDLNLKNNLLGDNLNPIFSSQEFHQLNNLRRLDLSGNKIKSIEEGLLKGCDKLQELFLDFNNISDIPLSSLNGPLNLTLLSLKNNQLTFVRHKSFLLQANLEIMDLRYNLIKTVESGAFSGMHKIREIRLGGNRITNLNSDVFDGVPTLERIDLSENFIMHYPMVALDNVEHLKVLNLSSNMLQRIDSSNLQASRYLEILDLSRNGITTIQPGTFRELKKLKYLDISLNSLRTVEDDALEGLDSLQTLIIKDNNILLLPGSALGRLPFLSTLNLDFNRVAALSSEILGSVQSEYLQVLTLSRNVIRELPAGTFQVFKNLHKLDLSGNSLAVVNSEIFTGLQASLIDLSLSQNKITNLGSAPLGLPQLRKMDLSGNNIADIPRNVFSDLGNLIFLNMSGNIHFDPVPPYLLKPLLNLQSLDLSSCGIKSISGDLFTGLGQIRELYLHHNNLLELTENTFQDLFNITFIDLSYNHLTSIRPQTFVNVMTLKKLNLKGNQLSAFKGEFFNTGTGLEYLDISNNQLTYLFPSSFRIHPRMKIIKASYNKFSYFPAELISSLQYLEYIDLSGNSLKTIEELDFARLPRLRELYLSHNELDAISEMAFHNSTQLQVIDLSGNKLDRIGERTFEGIVRLEFVDLSDNRLSELSEGMFDTNKVEILENINLANNKFEMAPLETLQKQHNFITTLNLSNNKIKLLPADDQILTNIKKLDLSYNPLSMQALKGLFNEPKTVRELNLAGTGISQIDSLETPFITKLNISNNNISEIPEDVFQRTTLMEELDLSHNNLQKLDSLSPVWSRLTMLKYLDLSNNSFEVISAGNFENLEMLRHLKLSHLKKCTKIEKNSLKHLQNLVSLSAYDLPILGYLDIQGIMELLPGIEKIDFEVKDSSIGTDQIQPSKHPRLKEISLRGERLKTISSGSLAGLKSNELSVSLKNTSLNALPPSLLFPVPRSSHLNLDITGSDVTNISPQFLTVIEDRRGSLKLDGLNSNPIHCDCNARALRRWLPSTHMVDVRCKTPEFLHNKKLIEVGDDELTCDPRKLAPTTLAPTTKLISSSRVMAFGTPSTTSEPMIIWSMEPTQPPVNRRTKMPNMKAPIMSNDDTLIIGIVGGVVAFIAILIIVICIVRLRMTSMDYPPPGPMMGMPAMPLGPGSVQMSYKGGPPTPLYAVQNYATLPHKGIHHSQQNLSSQRQPSYMTINRMSYFGNGQQQHTLPPPSQQQQSVQSQQHNQPYMIYSDEKAYR